MSEQNKAVIRRFVDEVWNQGRLDVADDVAHGGYRLIDSDIPPTRATGPEALRHEVRTYRTAFPDLRFTVEEMIAEGDKVAVRWSARGTHQGPAPFSPSGTGDWMFLPSTGMHLEATGMSIVELADGKIVSIRRFWRPASLLQSLATPSSRAPADLATEARRER